MFSTIEMILFVLSFGQLDPQAFHDFQSLPPDRALASFTSCVDTLHLEERLTRLFPFSFPPYQVELSKWRHYIAFSELRYSVLPEMIDCIRTYNNTTTDHQLVPTSFDRMNMFFSPYVVYTLLQLHDSRHIVPYSDYLKIVIEEHKLFEKEEIQSRQWSSPYWHQSIQKMSQRFHRFRLYSDHSIETESHPYSAFSRLEISMLRVSDGYTLTRKYLSDEISWFYKIFIFLVGVIYCLFIFFYTLIF